MPITLDGTLGITTPALTVDGATVNTGGISTAGNLTFTSTGNRILGDFSNATVANRVAFQTSTTNGNTALVSFPNGTGTNSTLNLYNTNDGLNASLCAIGVLGSTDVTIRSNITGTGTYLPMTFYTGGSERMRIDTSGNVGIGTTTTPAKTNIYFTTTSPSLGSSSGAALRLEGSSSAVLNFGNYGTSPYAAWIQNTDTGGGSSYPLVLNPLGGDVGIGTSSPSQKLHIQGNLLVIPSAGWSSGQTANMYIGDTGNGWSSTFGSLNTLAGYYGFAFTTTGTERMRITSGGNILAGTTTNNGAKLVLSGGINTPSTSGNMTSGYMFQAGDGSQALNFGVDSTGVWYNAAYANNAGVALSHRWFTGGFERMRITEQGNYSFQPAYSGTLSSGSYATLISNVSGTVGTAIKIYGHLSENGIVNCSFGEWIAVSDGTNWALNLISQAVVGSSYGTLNIQFSGNNLQIKSGANVALGQYRIVIEVYR